MNKHIKKSFVYSALVILLLSSCTEKENNRGDKVIHQTIDSVLNYVFQFTDTSKKIILLHKEYSDKTKSMSLDYFKKKNETNDYADLLKALITKVNDSVKFRFDNYRVNHIIVLEPYPPNSKIYDDPRYFGNLELSNSVDKNGLGCYYFALNCEDDCSIGLLVTAYYEEKWKVKKIYQLWGG